MKRKLNILLVFSLMLFNVFAFIPINHVSASEEEVIKELTEDEMAYAVGSIVNSTQRGSGIRTQAEDLIIFGKNVIGTLIDNGARLSDIVLQRGHELLFNPSGKIGLTNMADAIYGAYNDFANYKVGQVDGSRYILYLDDVSKIDYVDLFDNHLTYEVNMYGYHFVFDDDEEVFSPALLDSANSYDPNKFIKVPLKRSTLDGYNTIWLNYSYPESKNYFGPSFTSRSSYGSSWLTSTFGYGNEQKGNAFIPSTRRDLIIYPGNIFGNLSKVDPKYYTEYESLIFYNSYNYATKAGGIKKAIENDIVPFNSKNLRTRTQFTNDYKRIFNNITNNSNNYNQYISYDINEIFNETKNTIINENYISNNYINIVEITDPTDPTDPTNPTDPTDPTNPTDPTDPTNPTNPEPDEDAGWLENIYNAIVSLPQRIRDSFNDFEGVGTAPEPVEEGKGFWASLFGAIAELAGAFSSFIMGIPDLLLNLLDGLLGLVERVVELFIPTAEQMDQLSNSFSGLTDELSLKFAPVTDTVGAISDVYSSPKSVYDLSINYQGEEMPVIPESFREGISSFKPVLNGFIILSTFISIYKRFVGREDIIK